MGHGDMKGFSKAQAHYENQEDPAYSQEDAKMEECKACDGHGWHTEDEECEECDGSGQVEKEEEEEDFDIPDPDDGYDDSEADFEFDYEYDPH
jgi:RecJ-like exonuclease